MSRSFRSAPMGFNKKDVITYIEELVKEKDSAISLLKEENEALTTRSSELDSKCNMLVDKLRFSFALADQYKEKCAEAENQITALEADLEKAKGDAQAAFDEKALIYAENTKNLAECEAVCKHAEQLTDQNKALEQELSAKIEENAALNESIEAMAQQYALLEEAKQEAEKRADELADAKVLLEAKVTGLEIDIAETQGSLDAFGERINELEAERDSLKAANLRILKQNSELEKKLADMPEPQDAEKAELPTGSQELLALFKSRVDDMSAELSSLAQAILDAEKREGNSAEEIDFLEQVSWDAAADGTLSSVKPKVPFEDIPLDEEPIYDDDDGDDDLDDGIVETHVELKGYPVVDKPAVAASSSRRGGIREVLDRLINIGDRLM